VSIAEEQPTLVVNPPDDRAFEAFVGSTMDEAIDSPEQLQVVLRRRYPRSIVRRRDLAGERVQIWYVYRDGHWVRSGPG
jgi:hypothetical protein